MNALEKIAAKKKLAVSLNLRASKLLKKFISGRGAGRPLQAAEPADPRVHELLKKLDRPAKASTVRSTERVDPRTNDLLKKIYGTVGAGKLPHADPRVHELLKKLDAPAATGTQMPAEKVRASSRNLLNRFIRRN